MLGVFDSGIGGLTVVKEIKKMYPQLRVIYFGDAARVPYGGRSQETVQMYSSQITEFFLSKGITHMAIACNTISALAGNYLRNQFPEVEFFDVITPVVKRIKKEAAGKELYKVALIGTKGTIASGAYEHLITSSSPNVAVYSKACPLFVPLAEENWCEGEITKQIAQEYLQNFVSEKVESLILGCTHYPLLKKVIAEVMGPKVAIISSAEEIAKLLPAQKLLNGSTQDEYYFSDLTEGYKQFAQTILGYPITPEIMKLG